MTPQTQLAVFFMQLAAWFHRHPVVVRVAIIIVALVALTIWSYSVTYAQPLGTGGGGCC